MEFIKSHGKRVAAVMLAIIAVVLFLTGCGKTASSGVSAHATSSADKAAEGVAKTDFQGCFTKFGSKLPAEYKQFGDCVGVPPQNRKMFAEKALQASFSAHLSTQAGKTQFFTVTLPQIQQRCQATCL